MNPLGTTDLRGKKVALTLCPVWVGENPSEPTPMSGLFILEDYTPYEPSAYCWNSGWWIVSEGTDDVDDSHLWVDDSDLVEQIDPQGYGRQLVQEREMNFMEEDRDKMGMF